MNTHHEPQENECGVFRKSCFVNVSVLEIQFLMRFEANIVNFDLFLIVTDGGGPSERRI